MFIDVSTQVEVLAKLARFDEILDKRLRAGSTWRAVELRKWVQDLDPDEAREIRRQFQADPARLERLRSRVASRTATRFERQLRDRATGTDEARGVADRGTEPENAGESRGADELPPAAERLLEPLLVPFGDNPLDPSPRRPRRMNVPPELQNLVGTVLETPHIRRKKPQFTLHIYYSVTLTRIEVFANANPPPSPSSSNSARSATAWRAG